MYSLSEPRSPHWYQYMAALWLTMGSLKVKVLPLYSAAQLDQMVSVVLYNLTPGRGLTQPLV